MADVTTKEPAGPELADLLDLPAQDAGALEEPSDKSVQEQEPAEAPAVQEQEPPEPPAAAEPAEPAEKQAPEKLTYKGKEITVEELVRSGVLKNLFTTEEKYAQLQKKHQETLREQQEAQEAQRRAAEQQAAQREPLTQAKLLEVYAPIVKKTVAEGFLSADFAEAYPDEATQMCFYRDIIHDQRNRLDQVELQLEQIGQVLNQVMAQGTAQSWQSYLDKMFDQIAELKDGAPEGFFATLKEPEMREAFLEYLKTDLKPRREQITGDGAVEFLASQFVAFNKDAYAEAMRLAGNKQPRQDAKRRAAGESGGARGGGPQAPRANNQGAGIALDQDIFGGAPG